MTLEMKINALNIDEYVDYVQAETQTLLESPVKEEDLEKMINNQINDPELDRFLDSEEAENLLFDVEEIDISFTVAPIDLGDDSPFKKRMRKNDRRTRRGRFKKLLQWLKKIICEHKDKLEELAKKAIKSFLVSLLNLSGLILKLAIMVLAYLIKKGLNRLCPE